MKLPVEQEMGMERTERGNGKRRPAQSPCDTRCEEFSSSPRLPSRWFPKTAPNMKREAALPASATAVVQASSAGGLPRGRPLACARPRAAPPMVPSTRTPPPPGFPPFAGRRARRPRPPGRSQGAPRPVVRATACGARARPLAQQRPMHAAGHAALGVGCNCCPLGSGFDLLPSRPPGCLGPPENTRPLPQTNERAHSPKPTPSPAPQHTKHHGQAGPRHPHPRPRRRRGRRLCRAKPGAVGRGRGPLPTLLGARLPARAGQRAGAAGV